MKKKISNILIIISLLIIAFLICMKSPNDIFSRGSASLTDSSVFQYIGTSMAKGYVPYLELFDHKGLLLYFINYIGVSISTSAGIWIIELVFMFISLLYAYKLARKFTSKPISLLIVGIAFSQLYYYFEGGNLTEEYALPFLLISLNIFFDFFLEPRKYLNNQQKEKTTGLKLDFKLFNIPVSICGICCACVLFLRANMISVWIVFILMVLIYCIVHKKYIEIAKFAISFLIGILIVSIPMIIYLAKNGALESFINAYILFNMKYSSHNTKAQKLTAFINFFNTTITILAFIIIIMKIYNQIKKKEQWYFNLGYLIYMIITLVLISMPGNIYGHYGMVMIPALIYPYCIMYQFLEEKEMKSKAINLIVTAYMLYTIIVPVGIKFTQDCLNDIANRTKTNTDNVIEYIVNNTTEDDLISVFGNSNYIYLLSNRKSVSKYSYQMPIGNMNEEITKEYFEELKENRPKLIVWAAEIFDREMFSQMRQKMEEFLKENNYKLVQDGIMKIYSINGEM